MALLHPQVPTAQGRYLVSNSMTVSTKVVRDALAKAFPSYQFPAGQDTPSKLVIDNSKVRAPWQHCCALFLTCQVSAASC